MTRLFAPALIVLGLAVSTPQQTTAQTLMPGEAGGFDILAYEPYITTDWSGFQDLLDSSFEGQFESYPDRASFMTARRAITDGAIRMDGDDRVLVTVAGRPLPDRLKQGLRQYFPKMTADQMASFPHGLSVAAISYDDGQTFVTIGLMRKFGTNPNPSASAGGGADESGPMIKLAGGLEMTFPEDSRVVSARVNGTENGPQSSFSTVEVPLQLEAAGEFVEQWMRAQGLEPISGAKGNQLDYMAMTPKLRSTFSIRSEVVGDETISIITNMTNSY